MPDSFFDLKESHANSGYEDFGAIETCARQAMYKANQRQLSQSESPYGN